MPINTQNNTELPDELSIVSISVKNTKVIHSEMNNNLSEAINLPSETNIIENTKNNDITSVTKDQNLNNDDEVDSIELPENIDINDIAKQDGGNYTEDSEESVILPNDIDIINEENEENRYSESIDLPTGIEIN